MESIRSLPTEVLFQVVNYYCLFKRSAKSCQVFYEVDLTCVVVLQMHGMLSVQAMFNQTFLV